MRRLSLLLALLLPLAAPAAESEAARVEKEYRARRQAALAAQWMEIKLPIETPAAFLARLLDSAREGDSRATAALGWEFHTRGDKDRARMWLGRSAERGNPFAAYLLSVVDPPTADAGAPGETTVNWLHKAAEAGLPEAQFELALRHAQGKGAPLDLAEARRWYLAAAGQNYAPALCNLATMELQGHGGAPDLALAEAHFRAAAKLGFPQGNLGLGEVLRLQNRPAEALAPYRDAAEAGIVEAHFWLGCFAQEGLGRPRDEKDAARHFLKAALGGHALSQAIAADLLRRGKVAEPSEESAEHWDAEVAKFTNPELIAIIGNLYIEGKLVQRDLPKALTFLRKAAALGQPTAQRLAGTLLASGEAGERDLQEAYQWLWLAARGGQKEAEAAFEAVVRAMDGSQILEAARRADQFKPATP